MATDVPMNRRGLSPSWRLALWGTIAGLLAVPALVMQFTHEFNWGPEDFAAAGVLLGLAGLGLEWAARAMISRTARLVIAAGVLALLLVVWAELAVGIFN